MSFPEADMLKIIAKIGLGVSKLKMSNCKLFRTLTTDEIKAIINKDDDYHLMIVENIDESEQEEMKGIISSFCAKNEDNHVIFYLPDNDDITAGIADELDKNIYMSISEIYKVIHDKYNVNVSTSLEDKRKLNASEMSDIIPDDMTDIFGNIDTDEFEQADLDNREADAELVITEDTKELQPEELGNDNFKTVSEDDVASAMEEAGITLEEASVVTEDVMPESEPSVAIEKAEDEHKEEKADAKAEKTDAYIEPDDIADKTLGKLNSTIGDIAQALNKDLTRLKTELENTKKKYNDAVESVRIANTQIEKLSNEVIVLKDENESIKNTYNEIVKTDEVFEDPISLSEYEVIKNEHDGLVKEISELKEKITKLNENSEKDKEEAAKALDNLQKKYDKVKDSFSELNASIESGAIHQELIDSYEDQLSKLTSERDMLKENLDTVTDNVNSLTTRNRELSAALDLEQEYRVAAGDIIAKSFKQVYRNNNKHKEEIEDIKEQLGDADGKFDKERKEFENQINRLNESIKETEESKNELKESLNDTKNKLKETKEELNTLKIQSGDVAGIVENNKILEGQVRKLSAELDTAKNNITKLTSENEELSVQAKLGGGATAIGKNIDSVIPDIRLNGSTRVINVYGSGSYGVTTTAISIAYKLAPSSRVLFMDFNLSNPNADAFLQIMPTCKGVPGYTNSDIHATALGIVLDKGVDLLKNYYNNIVIRKENYRANAYLDYMSGIYYRIADVKLLSFNYTEFFNFLSNYYDYIIIDLGNFGSGEVRDGILKKFLGIPGNSSIAVTVSDMFKIRNFINSLRSFGIDPSMSSFVLNMCSTTAMNDNMKRVLNGVVYTIISEEPSIKQNKANFINLTNKIIRSQFEAVLQSII